MSRSLPRVTVVIPTFQAESRIGHTLCLLQRQTFAEFEAIVVNDGSTDGTSRVVQRLVESDSRIRLLEQSNQGVAAARNTGIAAARGELVAFLDDDDLWLPRKLELQVARLAAVPGAAVVSCWSALVDPVGRLLGWRLGGVPEGDVYREMLEWDMISGGSVVLVRRAVLEEAGGYDVSLADREDWDLWIRLARRHRFTCVPRTLVGYTRRVGAMSQNYEEMVSHGRAVLAKARREDPGIGDAELRAYRARDLFGAACLCLADEHCPAAWHYVARALRDGPRMILSRPRRWGVMLMLALATVLPGRVYRQAVLGGVGRTVFRMKAGAAFDSLAGAEPDWRGI